MLVRIVDLRNGEIMKNLSSRSQINPKGHHGMDMPFTTHRQLLCSYSLYLRLYAQFHKRVFLWALLPPALDTLFWNESLLQRCRIAFEVTASVERSEPGIFFSGKKVAESSRSSCLPRMRTPHVMAEREAEEGQAQAQKANLACGVCSASPQCVLTVVRAWPSFFLKDKLRTKVETT